MQMESLSGSNNNSWFNNYRFTNRKYFKGAKPYHQAHARGVKIIGATAHNVTADLDEGPIIHQDVMRVSHEDSVQDLVRLGRDLEKSVLAKALWWHARDQVRVFKNKTVVFD